MWLVAALPGEEMGEALDVVPEATGKEKAADSPMLPGIAVPDWQTNGVFPRWSRAVTTFLLCPHQTFL